MIEPPPADRELDVAIVEGVLRAQCPDMALTRVAWLGSGWEYDAFLIDEEIVARFPRNEDVAAGVPRALLVLETLQAWIGDRVGLPETVFVGEPSAGFPYPFVCSRFMAGLTGGGAGERKDGRLAADLGRALSALHSIPTHAVEPLGISPQKWTCRSAFAGLDELVREQPMMRELAGEAADWLDGEPTLPSEYAGPARVLHDDLSPEHIVVDPATGHLTGILDWGLAVGDPAQDLTFILPCWGWAFTLDLLDSYDVPVDEGFLDRLDFLGRVRAFGSLGHALAAQGGVDEALAWVRNAFEGRPIR